MKQYILSLVVVFVLVGCKEHSNNKDTLIAKSDALVANTKYQGDEPTEPEATEIYEPVPPKVTIDNKGVPSDAIVLFNGTDFTEWISAVDSTDAKWHLNGDGTMTVKDKAGDIQTKRNFGSVQLHVEWMSPAEIQREGQNRGNSGVYLQGKYEVQVLDNNNNDTYVNGQVGSVYKQSVPMAMASNPSGEWNTYDIIFHEPEFNEEGAKTKSGTITVLHNGVLVQDHFILEGSTEYIGWPKNEAHGKGPIKLQDHGDNSRVSYRNIWVRAL